MSIAPTEDPQRQPTSSQIAPAAQIETPPNAVKLALIRRFLRAIGLQENFDTGSFLEGYAIPGGVMWPVKGEGPLTEDLLSGYQRRISALRKAYEKHRDAYQHAYEDHLNWEFTTEELTQTVNFLESAVGKHYLDGRWRMEAYTGTNTEEIEREIVAEAQVSVGK